MGDWLDGAGNGSAIDIPAMFDGQLGDMVAEVCATGALVGLGLTSDNGALGITVTVDGRYRREYFRDGESGAEWLTAGLDDIRSAVEVARASRASSGTRKRGRGL